MPLQEAYTIFFLLYTKLDVMKEQYPHKAREYTALMDKLSEILLDHRFVHIPMKYYFLKLSKSVSM